MLASSQKIERIDSTNEKVHVAYIMNMPITIKPNQYKVGDVVKYIKADTIYQGKRIKASKVFGKWSEGRILGLHDGQEGEDLTEILGVTKHQSHPDNSFKRGLPYSMKPTDELRYNQVELPIGSLVDVTLKIDGCSMTIGYKLSEDKLFLTGRNCEVNLEGKENYNKVFQKYNLNKLKDYCIKHQVSLALRGEAYGNKISNHKCNPHAQLCLDVAFFSSYLIDENRYVNKDEDHYYTRVCQELDLPVVPLIETTILTDDLIEKYRTMETLDDKLFEGVVVKHDNGSFKIINVVYDSKK